jgi:rSAM/selenodomain-associated transferase 1
VKTRLAERLGPRSAARVYRRVAEAAAREAALLDRPGLERVAWIEPAWRTAEASRWLGPSFRCRAQGEGDLGARLAAAFGEAFESGSRRVVAIGSDCPDLGASLLGRAFDALGCHDAALGPAADGGYYLIGLARPLPEVFEGIPWSSAEVAAATLAILEEWRASVAVLPTLRDLDTFEDLEVLTARWPELLGDLDPA